MSDEEFSEFERKARQRLEASEHDIDPDRLQRLQAARRAAVAAVPAAPERGLAGRWWVPTGAMAAVALVLGLLLLPEPEGLPPVLDAAEMSAAQEMELLDELEFVAWMLEQESTLENEVHAG